MERERGLVLAGDWELSLPVLAGESELGLVLVGELELDPVWTVAEGLSAS